MPLKVVLKSGMQLTLPGDSYASLVASSVMGTIKLLDHEGDDCFLAKSEIAFCKQIAAAKWAAQIEAQRLVQDAQAKAEAEAQRRADAATLALLESKTLRGRLRKLLGRKA